MPGAHPRRLPHRVKCQGHTIGTLLRANLGHEHPFIHCPTSLRDARNTWVVSPGPTWWQDRMCLDVRHPTGKLGDYKCNLRWLLYSAAVEGATFGLSLTFKPPSPDALPNLIFIEYGICEVDSNLAAPDGAMGALGQSPGSAWLHIWFNIHPASPAVIARCPSMLKILRLRFQSDWLRIHTSIDSPECRGRQPPEITQSGCSGWLTNGSGVARACKSVRISVW